jgi:hypothetical protein
MVVGGMGMIVPLGQSAPNRTPHIGVAKFVET